MKPTDVEKMIKEAPKYNPDFHVGLSDEQVKKRIEDGLINKRRKTVTKSYFEIIVKNLFTVLNLLLIIIAVVMCYFGLFQRLFFALILFLNIVISLFQDIKARILVGRLSLLSSPRVDVIRNGNIKNINFNEIVLNDVIILKAGNTIPCDSTLLNGSIYVNESLLSGEAEDIHKEAGDKLYAEAVVTSGIAYAVVDKIGNANYVCKLQQKAREFSRPKSEILTSLTYIIRAISVTAIIIGVAEIITYGAKAALGNASDIVNIVDKVGSSVVGMIPIGMYLMTSITLTVGVIILSRHRILVRELYSIEMLARVNMICLDKTGTLTDGSMKVKELVPLEPNTIDELSKIIASLLYCTKDDNLTARALKEKFLPLQVKGNFVSIPFSSERKYSAASFHGSTYVLGAFGFVNATNNKAIAQKVKHYESSGYRVLVLATNDDVINDNKLPKGLKAIGLVVLGENIKIDAKKNIEWFKSSDVAIRVISGDSEVSLKNIARQVGIENYDKAISLEGLTNKEVKEVVKNHTIFGRVTPEQKKIIINELQNLGNTVAMVGDGVNDLLALKAADCSIAMASGSDAAKAASHLVSLDSNFSSLPKVVEEGRRVVNNLQRVCSIFLVKTLFAIFMSILFLILYWGRVGEGYPFKTNHLMVWEFITIGVAPFFVALEPNKERLKGNFVQNIIREAIPGAIAQIVVSLPLIIASYINQDLFPLEGAIGMVVVLLSCMSYVILFHVCRPLNPYRSRVLLGTFIGIGLFFVLDGLIYFYKVGIEHSVLQVEYADINSACLVLGFGLMVLTIPLYFLVSYLFTKAFRKKDYEQKRSH